METVIAPLHYAVNKVTR